MPAGASVEEGRGVSILAGGGRDAGGEHFEVQEAALAQLLGGVAERPLVLVSVAGALRGGKSFLLNFLLRYLYADERARADGSWLGAAHAPLRGFPWRGGSARDTAGLVLWSRPFPATLPSGEQVAVLLMDTQGTFDEHSSLRDSSQIFALATLLSSVLVYNVSRHIDENHLQHLQVFTELAAAAAAEGGAGACALPALQVLVRDWSAPYECAYGAAGGEAYLRHKLQEREQQPRELREVRRRLAASFARVRCFLLPHPGLRATADPAFAGHLADLTEEFKTSLRELVPLLLAPERLRVLTVAGRRLCARDLAPLLRAHLAAFQHRVPSPQDMLTATATVRWQAAAAEARAAAGGALPRNTLPRAALRERLDAVRGAALAPLRPLAERADDLQGLANLEREIDEQLARHVEINSERLAAAVAGAELEWEQAARALRVQGALCRHARRLEQAAAAARAAALARYDRAVPAVPAAAAPHAGDDADRAGLLAWTQSRYDELIDMNTRNSWSAVDEAERAFAECMRRQDSTLARSAAALDAQLAAAVEPALHQLRQRRASLTDFGVDDLYYDRLMESMRRRCDGYHCRNGTKATTTDVVGVAAQIALLGLATVATGPLGAVASAGAIVALVGNCINAYNK